MALVATSCSLFGEDNAKEAPPLGVPSKDLDGIRVVIFGDSLISESSGEMAKLADAGNYRVSFHAKSGQTPCNGLDALTEELRDPPDVMVFAYAGNTRFYSECLGPPSQTFAQANARYKELLTTMVAQSLDKGVRVGLLGGPAWPHNELAPMVFETVKNLAADLKVPFLDGGIYVTPNRTWSATVQCVKGEQRCHDGQVDVHFAEGEFEDDVHFDCPVPGYLIADNMTCPVYSAGSYRYAYAIDELIRTVAASP